MKFEANEKKANKLFNNIHNDSIYLHIYKLLCFVDFEKIPKISSSIQHSQFQKKSVTAIS